MACATYMSVTWPLVAALGLMLLYLSRWDFTMKFTTPQSIADYFYFNVDFRDMMTKLADDCDEVIGFSIGRLYIGFYGNSISWGILDENGSLWLLTYNIHY